MAYDAGETEGFNLTKAQDKAMDVLISDATHIALDGGSRSGKTFLLVFAVLARALKEPDSRHAIFRFRFNALKASVIRDTLVKVIKLAFPGLPAVSSMLNQTDWYLELPNGSQVWFAGLDDKERTEKILGMEFATLYFNECSQIPWGSVKLALTRLAMKTGLKLKAYYDLNPPSKAHWTYRVFHELRSPDDKQPLNETKYGHYNINPADNQENLPEEYLDMLKSMPARERKRFWFGQYADIDEGALWTEELLDQNRILDGVLPDMLRVNVAVDPSGCSGPEDERSDEVGITVNGLGTDGHGYLLEDLSGRHGPEKWGKIVASAYERYSADRVVGEVNYGGDMVRAIIQAQDPNIPYVEVRATRGKVRRAEPISTLYEQEKVHMVGHFPEVEEQLCGFTVTGYLGQKSPDRADSHIWGMTDFFSGIVREEDTKWTPPQVQSRKRSASRISRL